MLPALVKFPQLPGSSELLPLTKKEHVSLEEMATTEACLAEGSVAPLLGFSERATFFS